MSGIKYILQKEVCEEDEKIVSVVHVSKVFKKKNTSYLCVVAKQRAASVVQVKHDKGLYKVKNSWSLGDLKQIDGRNEASDTHEFDLLLVDKQYKWFAPNTIERQNFITALWKHTNKTRVKIEFKNIPKNWFSLSPEHAVIKEEAVVDEESDLEFEDFNALTEKEETDLNKLMKECNYAISNAELFMDELSKNLHDLDGVRAGELEPVKTKDLFYRLTFKVFWHLRCKSIT